MWSILYARSPYDTCDGGVANIGDMRDFDNPADTYNYAPVNFLQTPY
ncbi:MAG: hypothetical protein HRU24_19005 [Gammaproteobacteria bacterium]|nr:hypothetical protein [Colwellia sp.]NQY47743.1 hypothetical protein [Colwellia sp.]NRA73086.1 hypothetical protein [Gammaproteobacteria bacterium]